MPRFPLPVRFSGRRRKPTQITVVNGVSISGDDFFRALYRMERLVINMGKPLGCSQITRLRTEVAEGLIRRELLYQESKKKVRASETEITAELEKMRDQIQTTGDFASASAPFRPQVERALGIRKFVETEFVSKAVVTDKEIWSYYDSNRNSFRQPEQVRASHIFVKAGGAGDPRKAEARRKIEEVKKKIKEGQDFGTLARTYSDDASGSKGGDLGYVRMGQIVKPLEDALFALKPGEVSDVVETSLGYHLVKATDRKPETTAPFETVKDQLRSALQQEKGQQAANAFVTGLREKAKVELMLPAEEP